MTNKELFGYIDHTLLSPTATIMQIRTLCIEAAGYKCASVCIPPCYVKQVRKEFPDLNICTVIGFPLGYSSTEAKLAETKQALADGADESEAIETLSGLIDADFQE